MAKAKKAKAAASAGFGYYRWIFLLSLPVAAIFLFRESLDWGSLSDDAWYFYGDGLKSWPEILRHFFLPHAQRIFFFGEDRPLWNLFYKTMHWLAVSPTEFHLIHWVLDWGCCLGFSWGIVSLARLAFTVPSSAIWMSAAFLYWTPAAITISIASLLDLWFLGLIGMFWGVMYASEESLPGWLRPPVRRWSAAAVFVFLALKIHEASFIVLGWTSAYLLLLAFLKRGGKRTSGRMPSANAFRAACVPGLIAIAFAMAYRSFDPAMANRSEIQVSMAIPSLIHVGWHYVLMGLQAYSHPLVDWLSIRSTGVGYEATDFPWAFLLALASFVALGLIPRPAAVAPRFWNLRWVIVAIGIVVTLPYLSMVNRQLAYYPVRLNAFTAAFLAISFAVKGENPAYRRLAQTGAAFYLASVLVAGVGSFEGWNYIRFFGGEFRKFSDSVLALPGARDCSSESPCCLEIPGRTWGRHEGIVDWNLGAPTKPPFVQAGAGMPCARTIRVP